MAIIYTIGHSNVTVQKLIELLKAYGIEVVMDVRSEPYSKYASHFNKREIEPELRKHGFEYCFYGEKLGGKPKSPGSLPSTVLRIMKKWRNLRSLRPG